MKNEHSRLGRSVRRRLRELAGEAHDLELGAHLDELFAHFQAWKRGEVSAGELNDRVHDYHQGPNRDVFRHHSALKPDEIVARAIALGTLEEEGIEERILEILSPLIESFRHLLALRPEAEQEPDSGSEEGH